MIDCQQPEEFLIVLQDTGREVEMVFMPDVSQSNILSSSGTRLTIEDFQAKLV